MRKLIIFLIITCTTILFSIERSNREVLIEGIVLYNGNFTLSNPAVFVFDLSNGNVSYCALLPDGTYSFTLNSGEYYIYVFSAYTDNDDNFAYGIHSSCLYPEIVYVEEGQPIDALNLELLDYCPIYLTRFVEAINFGQTEVIPLEFFHMPLNCYEQHYLYAEQDSIKIYGAKIFGFSGFGSIEEIIYDENAVWCPIQMSINDIWTTAFVDRDSPSAPIAFYAEMEAIGSQTIQVNSTDETAIITESINNNSELIKKWFVSDLGIVKQKQIIYYQDIPYLHMNLELYDLHIESGSGMMPLDENNRWVYSLIFYNHPTDLISINQDDSVLLKWDPPYGQEPEERDEIDWLGYHIYEDDILFQTVDATQTEFVITNPNNTHEYYVTAYNDGGDTEPSNTIIVNWTGINEQLPNFSTHLFKNYPNPFNPTTTINFNLKNNSLVNLSIYNIKGQLVKILVDKNLSKGRKNYIWNGINDQGLPVPSGIYLYKLEVNGKTVETKKMSLIK
jgi:hypothetical protein